MKPSNDIELAKMVGFNTEHEATNEYLHRFAEMVREDEREECAKRLDLVGCDHCAANIRARGKE
jgi:hypothetical protein